MKHSKNSIWAWCGYQETNEGCSLVRCWVKVIGFKAETIIGSRKQGIFFLAELTVNSSEKVFKMDFGGVFNSPPSFFLYIYIYIYI